MFAIKFAAALSLLVLTSVLGSAPQAAGQSESPATLQPTTAQPATAQPTTPSAAASRPSNPSRRPRGLYRRQTIDDRVKTFAKALDLNDKQQAGVKAVLERQQTEARQIQFDPVLSGQERIGKFRALQEDTVLRIRALLNDEQKKKYDPLNHGKQEAGSSDQYVDQWMKNHQRTENQTQPAQK